MMHVPQSGIVSHATTCATRPLRLTAQAVTTTGTVVVCELPF
jgi:hypothetical protein